MYTVYIWFWPTLVLYSECAQFQSALNFTCTGLDTVLVCDLMQVALDRAAALLELVDMLQSRFLNNVLMKNVP